MMHHAENPAAMLEEMSRVVESGATATIVNVLEHTHKVDARGAHRCLAGF